MAQQMRELFPGRSAQHALGAELRNARLGRGLSQARLGTLVHYSGALIGKIEKAESLPTAECCALLDDALDTGGRLSRMWPTADPRRSGLPVEFVASPWHVPTSVHLLHKLTGKIPRGREFVSLTDANRDTVLAGWRAATPAPGAPADTPAGPSIGPAALDLITGRLAGLRVLNDVLTGPVLRGLVLAELRCLADLFDGPAAPLAELRRLLGLAAEAARLGARLHLDTARPGRAQSFYLAALRCTADAGDPLTGADILAEMDRRVTVPAASGNCDRRAEGMVEPPGKTIEKVIMNSVRDGRSPPGRNASAEPSGRGESRHF